MKRILVSVIRIWKYLVNLLYPNLKTFHARKRWWHSNSNFELSQVCIGRNWWESLTEYILSNVPGVAFPKYGKLPHDIMRFWLYMYQVYTKPMSCFVPHTWRDYPWFILRSDYIHKRVRNESLSSSERELSTCFG